MVLPTAHSSTPKSTMLYILLINSGMYIMFQSRLKLLGAVGDTDTLKG